MSDADRFNGHRVDPRRKVTPAQWEAIVRRYVAGESAAALAAEFHVTASAVYNRAGRRGP